MARTVTMLRYRFDPGIWRASVTDASEAQRIGRAFQINRLFGPDGRQFGFVSCRYINGIVVGYYTQEGTKEFIKYNSDVQPTTLVETSFAHILFALHVETGVVAIQKTRIIGFVDMVLSDMRKQFPIAVEELMREISIPVVRLFLEKDTTEITSEQLYRIFQNYKTTSLNIVNLKGKKVPSYEEFKIFNPRVDEDRIFRQVFEEDIQSGLDNLTLKAPETDNLGDTALARLSTVVGDIKSLTVDPQNNGQGVYLTTKVADRFKVPVSSDDEKQPISEDDIGAIARPLTLTLTLQGAQGDISQLLSSLLTLANFTDEQDDEDDDE